MNLGIVCIGNYCRSPVAEVLLKELLKYPEISSAGISPFVAADMHPFSRKYLNNNGCSPGIHTPKAVNKAFIQNKDTIFCLDLNIQRKLIHSYPEYKERFIQINFLDTELHIPDPVTLKNKDDYFRILDNLKHSCEKIAEYYKVKE